MNPLPRLRYYTSHCLFYLKNFMSKPKHIPRLLFHRLPHFIENMNRNLTLRYIGYLSNILLMAALCVGLYTRWMATREMIILVMAVCGLFIFAISCALVYYFSMESVGLSLSRLWIGCLLGVIAFTQITIPDEDNTAEEVLNILLVLSILLRALWNILERVLNFSEQQFALVNYYECLEMIGMGIATIVTGNDLLCLSLLTVAFSFIVINIRLKSFLGVIQLVLMITIASFVYFPHLLEMKVNVFATSCFLVRLGFEAILDLYYCPLSTLERWGFVFRRAGAIRRLLILLGAILETAYVVVNAIQIPRHKEWFIVVPIFAAFGTVWFSFHVVFLITCWQLSNKISDCNATYGSLGEDGGGGAGGRSMRRIMAAKGVRHFSLISQRLVCVSVLTTIVVAGIGWRTKSALSLSLLMCVLPLETAVLSMLWHLGSSLGGTVIGYALVAPALPIKAGQGTVVLATSAVQEVSGRATLLLNVVQRFFQHHLVDNYGCDYSSAGLSEEAVAAKLRAFFQRHTADGPQYDTYVVYYSGHVLDNGDWALAGGGTLKLTTLLEWWEEFARSSRLILVLDTDKSYAWVRPISRLRHSYVAIQTCRLLPHDPEEGARPIGSLTTAWMDYNSWEGEMSSWKEYIQATGTDKLIHAQYGVSRNWSDFEFHLPTDDEIREHWHANFPRATRPLVAATNLPRCGRGAVWCCCVDCVARCWHRYRMAWFPPAEYHTGHGFRLVRS